VFSQYLRSIGLDATAESTEFTGEGGADQSADIVDGSSSVDPLIRPTTIGSAQ
jgi:hypothetical protein